MSVPRPVPHPSPRGSPKSQEFGSFVALCNGHEERIKVTYEICEKEAVFLDVKVSKNE